MLLEKLRSLPTIAVFGIAIAIISSATGVAIPTRLPAHPFCALRLAMNSAKTLPLVVKVVKMG